MIRIANMTKHYDFAEAKANIGSRVVQPPVYGA